MLELGENLCIYFLLFTPLESNIDLQLLFEEVKVNFLTYSFNMLEGDIFHLDRIYCRVKPRCCPETD